MATWAKMGWNAWPSAAAGPDNHWADCWVEVAVLAEYTFMNGRCKVEGHQRANAVAVRCASQNGLGRILKVGLD
jgi:hypothetical protein